VKFCRLFKITAAMSSVFHSSIGHMHNFHQTLPADCRCLHVTVIGNGSGLSLYFRGQERNTSFVMPLFEGVQSVCTGSSRYSLSTWWTGGVSLHSFEWLPTAYPAGHYALRFVYRRPYDGDLPKLTTYCWSVVHSMLLDKSLPLAVRRADPTGAYRHCVLYVEYNVTYERQPTCTPASCAYYEWCRQQL
jgi:hypothetical protein